MLVTTAMVGVSSKKLPSLHRLQQPGFALSHLGIGAEHMNTAADDHRRIEPREAQTAAVIEVVVVFPWLPATAMPYFMRIKLGEHFRSGDHRISRRRASSTSGFEYLTAVEITTTEGFTVKFSS